MTFDNDFEDIFSDFNIFDDRLLKRMRKEMDQIIEDIESGKVKGTWEKKEINEPGVKGFMIQARFGNIDSMEPLEPMKPQRRRPLPENPFELPKKALKETREPLTDIFEEKDATKIYVELPGEEKEDIQLNFKDKNMEVKAKNFYKTIELPRRPIDKEAVKTEYKNGVLQITIPKKIQLRKEDVGKEKTV